MKDFLNFQVTSKQEGASVRHTIRHKKRDNLAVSFLTTGATRPEHMPDLITGIMRAWTYKYFQAMRKPLSKKQKEFYDGLVWFHKEENRAPSYQEMIDILGYKSKGTASIFVNRLIDKGWLWKDEDGRPVPIDIAAPDMTE